MKTIIPRLFGVIKMKNNIELHRVYFIPKTCQDAQQRQSCIMTALIALVLGGGRVRQGLTVLPGLCLLVCDPCLIQFLHLGDLSM